MLALSMLSKLTVKVNEEYLVLNDGQFMTYTYTQTIK